MTGEQVSVTQPQHAQVALVAPGGPVGPPGPQGPPGPTGPGVPNGGTAGQVLSKVDATNQNTTWTTPPVASAVAPAALTNATNATIGVATAYARGDHRHQLDYGSVEPQLMLRASTGRNLISNANFMAPAYVHAVSASAPAAWTLQTAGGLNGSNFMQCTGGAAAGNAVIDFTGTAVRDSMTVAPGQTFRFAAIVKRDAAAVGTATLYAFTVGSAAPVSVVVASATAASLTVDTWTIISGTWTVPAGVYSVMFRFYIANPTAGVWSLDSVLLENNKLNDPTFTPADHGFISWPYDPACVASAGALTGGQLVMVRMHIPYTTLLRGVHTYCTTAGSGLVAGQCFAALYDANFALRAQSADQSTAWSTINVKRMDFTTPYLAPAGDYFAALLANGTTPPAFPRNANNVFTTNLGGNAARFAVSLGPFTALPDPAPAVGATSFGWWWALY